jgi:hypothetical protein
MIAQAVLGVVGDLVFKSAAALVRSYSAELSDYLDGRGFVAPRRANASATR